MRTLLLGMAAAGASTAPWNPSPKSVIWQCSRGAKEYRVLAIGSRLQLHYSTDSVSGKADMIVLLQLRARLIGSQ